MTSTKSTLTPARMDQYGGITLPDVMSLSLAERLVRGVAAVRVVGVAPFSLRAGRGRRTRRGADARGRVSGMPCYTLYSQSIYHPNGTCSSAGSLYTKTCALLVWPRRSGGCTHWWGE